LVARQLSGRQQVSSPAIFSYYYGKGCKGLSHVSEARRLFLQTVTDITNRYSDDLNSHSPDTDKSGGERHERETISADTKPKDRESTSLLKKEWEGKKAEEKESD
jgi:hypothetical protein